MVVNSVHWFRKGLRLHDNPALQEALSGADSLRCVYVLDPWFAGAANVGINRWRFLLEALEDLDCSLKKLNSRLFVVRGQPTDVFPRLLKVGAGPVRSLVFQSADRAGAMIRASCRCLILSVCVPQEWKVTRLTFEYDPRAYGKERDGAIIKMAQQFGVETIVRNSHTLYNLDRIVEMNNNSPPLTFKRFQTIVSRLELPRRPLPSVTQQQMDKCGTPVADNHDQLYSIPSLEELGFRTGGLAPAVWRGGESEALERLRKHLEKKVWVSHLEHSRANTCSLYASPAGLSPYLRFGCLSCRVFYYNLREHYIRLCKGCSPPLSLFGQLLWREFFYTAATNNPNFDRMAGNPICVQVGVHAGRRQPVTASSWASAGPCPRNPSGSGGGGGGLGQVTWWSFLLPLTPPPDPGVSRSPDPLGPEPGGFGQVGGGSDGLPLDRRHHDPAEAGGLDPPPARRAVACFLTRGDLWISWECGMKVGGAAWSRRRRRRLSARLLPQVFEELLLDADWSVNAGSWMWLSCSAFFQQFFKCYCPVGFGRRTDPSGDYIRRYIPILKDYPNRYIYEPWNAPEAVQKAANCVVGVDYPRPMIQPRRGQQAQHREDEAGLPAALPLQSTQPPGLRANNPGGGGATHDRRVPEQQRAR
ncbi:unnamed protein product [Tetraodon nigroviridis]|uniref:(spotted green pufferfish) hypothetical protein n=1 Tax=Tetraodon nigroviridis TaxID=99883 RepID=Q4T243_TETNG|nr:unnamed protein product [Tetraodon nigroviridis]